MWESSIKNVSSALACLAAHFFWSYFNDRGAILKANAFQDSVFSWISALIAEASSTRALASFFFCYQEMRMGSMWALDAVIIFSCFLLVAIPLVVEVAARGTSMKSAHVPRILKLSQIRKDTTHCAVQLYSPNSRHHSWQPYGVQQQIPPQKH